GGSGVGPRLPPSGRSETVGVAGARAPARRRRRPRRRSGRAVPAASASVHRDERLPVDVPEGRRRDRRGAGAERDLDEVVDAIRRRQTERDRAEPEGDAPRTALHEPNAPDAADAARAIGPDESTPPNLLQRAGRYRHAIDVVVVAERDRERLRRRIGPRGHAAEIDPEREDVPPGLIAEADRATHTRDALRTVPDRRRPGALLDGLRDSRIAALAVAGRHGGRVAAVDALRVAEIRAPPAGGVLEHA